ncbi:SDR family NAD(P)-dependent oxidoreductase [Rubrivirga sp. S365]|uniref:SDR family NAD(P)-dependent oxidoreductase n=1 Tax=Rubrivirga litoralis TaxID=3075598 RepID=A0ABU3BTH7_9BACT|nr:MULTISPECIES: SDR family NAD(P)-dependent oxidoreductase [unclassified Rubrivirga]MDT0632589.1 SDR family NAD(P)-dependent oxidoreductase [Rubrivirga sp. F394]MDT7856721.1 SDR family NAD(P)-dependent oxidoreductase [Rubrivirga sp. S365]
METDPRLEPSRRPAPAVDLADRPTALVTGSNGGVGLALAQKLGRAGWRVLLHGRDGDKLARAHARMDVGAPHEAFQADLANPDAVRRLADSVREATDRLDVLVHNAGLVRPSRERTAGGAEMTVAVNALAPFVLTEALRPLLERTAADHDGARVVTVSSEAQKAARLPAASPEGVAEVLRGTGRERYSSIRAYAQSKLVATVWTLELARRLEGAGVTANACHPGVVRTGVFGGVGGVVGLLAQAASPLYLSPEQGAESPFLLATAPRYGQRTGRWVTRGRFRGPHEAAPPGQAADPAVGGAVWDALARLAGD